MVSRRFRTGALAASLSILPIGCNAPGAVDPTVEPALVGVARQSLCYGHAIADVVIDPATYHWQDAAHLLASSEGFGPRALSLNVTTSVQAQIDVTGTRTPKDSEISLALGHNISKSVSLDASSTIFVPVEGYARLEAYATFERATWDIVGTDCWGPAALLGTGVSYRPIGIYFATCEVLAGCPVVVGPIPIGPSPAEGAADAGAPDGG